jgi:hypothetical protein
VHLIVSVAAARFTNVAATKAPVLYRAVIPLATADSPFNSVF